MRRIDVLKALSVVGSSLVVDELILVFDLDGEDLHTVDQFLCVCRVVLGEVHINEASQGVTVGSHSHHSVFIGMAVNDLFLQASSFISWADILALLGVDGVSAEDACLLLSIKLLNCGLLLLFNTCLVFGLRFLDLGIMFLFEGLVFLHDTVHVTFVYIHHDHFLTLLQCLIFVLKT